MKRRNAADWFSEVTPPTRSTLHQNATTADGWANPAVSGRRPRSVVGQERAEIQDDSCAEDPVSGCLVRAFRMPEIGAGEALEEVLLLQADSEGPPPGSSRG